MRNIPRTATIKTASPCVFLSLQREQFSYLLSRSDRLRETLEQVLQERMGAQAAPFQQKTG